MKLGQRLFHCLRAATIPKKSGGEKDSQVCLLSATECADAVEELDQPDPDWIFSPDSRWMHVEKLGSDAIEVMCKWCRGHEWLRI